VTAVALASLRLDGGTQTRAAIDPDVVSDYADSIRGGATLPPIVAFFDGESYWVADGFHREAAHRSLGRESVDVDVRQGTRRDAILYSVGANGDHGLRRTNADKRRAVEVLLRDEEWSAKSNRWIAEACAVSADLVDRMRSELPVTGSSKPAARAGRDGKTRKPAKRRTIRTAAEALAPPAETTADAVRHALGAEERVDEEFSPFVPPSADDEDEAASFDIEDEVALIHRTVRGALYRAMDAGAPDHAFVRVVDALEMLTTSARECIGTKGTGTDG
jgi:ParB-like chromosome segregation protein Spo0J